MRNRCITLFSIFLAISMVTWYGCKKTDRPLSQTKSDPLVETVTASVHGRVVDENGKPVSHASVQSDTYNTTTDINGVFRFSNIKLRKNAGFVLVEKNDYFTSGRTIFTNAGVVNNIEIKLIPKKKIGNFQTSVGGNINIGSGAAINFTVNGIIEKSSNTVYSGTVTVFGAYLNPRDPDLASIMPGNLTGLNLNNEQKILQTYGMIAVELQGSNGEMLELAVGKPATITIPIPSDLQPDAPTSIPLWYFDDSLGIWKEEGTALKQNTSYTGNVSHFTFWNCDIANDFVNLKVSLKNQGQELLSGYRVALRNKETNSSSNGYTDSSGTVNGAIPPGVSLEMIVYNRCNTPLHTETIGPFITATDLGVVTITTPSAATLNISGTVTKCNLAPVTNGVIDFLLEGLSYRAMITNGSYKISIERCNALPANLNAIAMDIDANQQSSLTSVNVTKGNYTANIRACGISNEEFVTCTVGSDTFNFIPANDTFGSYRYKDSTTEITASHKQMDSATFQFINFRFPGPAAPGLYSTNFILLFRGNPSYLEYLIDNPMVINITEYGNLGEFVAGSFIGSMRERFTNTVVPATCTFRLRRLL